MKLTCPLCLASASPRRAELLTRFGLRFRVHSTNVDETPRPGETPEGLVRRLAESKARQASQAFPRELVLAGDTVVALEGSLPNKPVDMEEGMAMLRRLSGRSHQVVSAYFLLDGVGGKTVSRVVSTRVTFRKLDEEWIRWYGAQPEGRDKAGGYGIQGLGGAMVADIAGSYTCVVGLPIEEVIADLRAQGWLELEA